MPRVSSVNFRSYLSACYLLVLNVIRGIWAITFAAKNFEISRDWMGLARSAVFLFFPLLCSPSENHHMFKGSDDLNGNGYFHMRLHWTGAGFQANIVEEDVLLSILSHISASLKRTRDRKLSTGLMGGHLKLAITGLMLLTFMTIHLFQFRDTEQYFLRTSPTLINWLTTLTHAAADTGFKGRGLGLGG